nr:MULTISPECIES: hypothetical protein [unclassified Providencia]
MREIKQIYRIVSSVGRAIGFEPQPNSIEVDNRIAKAFFEMNSSILDGYFNLISSVILLSFQSHWSPTDSGILASAFIRS